MKPKFVSLSNISCPFFSCNEKIVELIYIDYPTIIKETNTEYSTGTTLLLNRESLTVEEFNDFENCIRLTINKNIKICECTIPLNEQLELVLKHGTLKHIVDIKKRIR